MSRELIESIFNLDKGVRYTSILSPRGSHLEGGMRPGIASLNPEEEEQRLFVQSSVSRGMSESWLKYFDEFKYSIIAYSKVNIFQFPFGENILLVTTDLNVSLLIADRILALIKKYNK